MADGDVGIGPQVFVVDTQANFVSLPGTKKPMWAHVGQKFLLLLVGLTLLGLVVEGFFIYKLYKQNEALFLCKSYPLCQNLSTPTTSAHQGGNVMGRVGHEESNDIPTVQPHPQQLQNRPFAHLIGPNSVGQTNEVQWVKDGDAFTNNMSYNNGRLSIKKEGYYYLYSNVQLDARDECVVIQHKIMKETKAYGKPIELMKSKNTRCQTPKTSSGKTVTVEDLRQSFLAGIFHLESGDQIFVTLDNIQKMRPGPTENFMGAFMVSP